MPPNRKVFLVIAFIAGFVMADPPATMDKVSLCINEDICIASANAASVLVTMHVARLARTMLERHTESSSTSTVSTDCVIAP